MSPFAVILLLVFFWLITLVLILWSLLTPRRSADERQRRPARAHAREHTADSSSDSDDESHLRKRGVRVVAESASPTGERRPNAVRIQHSRTTSQTAQLPEKHPHEARDAAQDERFQDTPKPAPSPAEQERARANDRAFERFLTPKNDDLEL